MRVLYAPDSYGGFLGAPAACRIAAAALAARGVELETHPMADGGEGTLEVLEAHGVVEARGFVESAVFLGPLRPGMGGPWQHRTSAALGNALHGGPARIGLGGTATMDAGAGALQALGLDLRGVAGRALPVPLPAAELTRVARIEGPPPTWPVPVEVLCDVRTPLAGAPRFYGPQKGLSPADVETQVAAFLHWAEVIGTWRARLGLAALPTDLPGGGAAGGLGFALASVGARLLPGAEQIARWTRLDVRLVGLDAVVVGEGRMDEGSFEGKVADVAIQAARRAGVPRVIALVGQVREVPPPPRGPDEVVVIGGQTMEAFMGALERLADALG
ncbi:MAG: glycerate kinase [Pseudomonadota bacterium]